MFNVGSQIFFLRILTEVVYKLNCVVARNVCWFTMATLSDGIDSQMMLCTIPESTRAVNPDCWIRQDPLPQEISNIYDGLGLVPLTIKNRSDI